MSTPTNAKATIKVIQANENSQPVQQTVLGKDVVIMSDVHAGESLAVAPGKHLRVAGKAVPAYEGALYEAEVILDNIHTRTAQEFDQRVQELQQLGFGPFEPGQMQDQAQPAQQEAQPAPTQSRDRRTQNRGGNRRGRQNTGQPLTDEERRRRASEASRLSRQRRREREAQAAQGNQEQTTPARGRRRQQAAA